MHSLPLACRGQRDATTLTLYLLKAFWMILAASYSSLCSPSVSVSRAKSLSIFPLAEAFRNSAHAADDGGRSLWRASALRGEGGHTRLQEHTHTHTDPFILVFSSGDKAQVTGLHGNTLSPGRGVRVGVDRVQVSRQPGVLDGGVVPSLSER